MSQRIGIVTLLGNSNIGNRLQNFALHSALAANGHQSWTVPVSAYIPAEYPRRDQLRDLGFHRYEQLREIGALGAAELVRKRLAGLNRRETHEFDSAREESLATFARDRIPLGPQHIKGPGDGITIADDYDLFIVGSDQVWNPAFTFCCPAYFLTFAEKSKRVAYSPSFGWSRIPPHAARLMAPWLSGIPHLSVREQSGARIIQQLTGREAPVVLDPTMLVDRAAWAALADEAPDPAPGPFIAHCFLSRPSRRRRQDLQQMGERAGLDVVDILRPKAPNPSYAGVQAFLRAILTADFVLTDSFHATVFAILFERPFLTFPRGPMTSRISTLLSLADLGDRFVEKIPRTMPPTPSWEATRRAIARERALSLDYLRRSVAGA